MKIIFIFSCSGMFRDVPECSVFRVLSTTLLESPAIVTCRATLPSDFLEKSHISRKIYSTSEGSCEVQIKLPMPVLTYVLVQCLLTNL